jgi:hypothetical protein
MVTQLTVQPPAGAAGVAFVVAAGIGSGEGSVGAVRIGW